MSMPLSLIPYYCHSCLFSSAIAEGECGFLHIHNNNTTSIGLSFMTPHCPSLLGHPCQRQFWVSLANRERNVLHELH